MLSRYCFTQFVTVTTKIDKLESLCVDGRGNPSVNRSPIVARWELSRRLATRRRELGLGVSAITSALDFTRNYWSAVENDRTLIAEDKLRLLFDVLRFDPDEQEELLQLRRKSKQRGWWDDYPNLIDDARRFFGLEDGATRIRMYDSNIIPGLLQIPDYTRAILESDPAFSPLAAERRLTMRAKRQELLSRPDPLSLTALLSEAALLQQVDGPQVQRRQLEHLLQLLSDDHRPVEVRVIPFNTNPGAIVSSSTLLLFDFDSEHLPEVAWQEAIKAQEITLSNTDEFRRLDHCWQEGLETSLSSAESIELIRETVERSE